MLTLFPEILFLAPFSATAIRVALACVLGFASWRHVSHRSALARALGILEAAVAVSLALGFGVQLVAIAAAVIIIGWLFVPATHTLPRSTALLSLVLAFSLLITGAGAFAFDLPL